VTPESIHLRQGDIVWADVPDPRGARKIRPLVIITADSDMLLDKPVVGVALTTTIPDPAPADYVELPWFPKGHPTTGLTKRSAAVCSWLVELKPTDVRQVKGSVPTLILETILERVIGRNA
jgi:hypothetical protein